MDRLQLVTHEQHVQQLRAAASAARPASPPADSGSGRQPGGAGDGGGAAVAAAAKAARAELAAAIVDTPGGAGGDGASGGPLLTQNDLRLAGCVAWVGRSSLEVVIELADRAPGADAGGWRRRGEARFVLVAKATDPAAGPLRIRPLAPGTPAEEELCAAAAARQEARVARRAAEAAAAAAQAAGGAAAAAAAAVGPDAARLTALVSRARQHRVEQWQARSSTAGGGGAAAAAVPMGATSLQVTCASKGAWLGAYRCQGG
jgi:hypothetical protein